MNLAKYYNEYINEPSENIKTSKSMSLAKILERVNQWA